MPHASTLLVRAARGEVVERPPVWAMRQAGRWDPEFAKLRRELSFYDFSENVELAAQASLLPRRFGVDAIILFYDITTLAIAIGLPFALHPGRGPVPTTLVRSVADVSRLAALPDPQRFRHIRQLLARVREEIENELPIIVFAGAPFTLASYCIGTGKDIRTTRQFAAERPEVWQALLGCLQSATIHFLRTLVSDGADLYQLFDSWAGLLNPSEYELWAQRHHRAIFTGVRDVPGILFVKECPHLQLMTQTGAQVVSLGTRHNLAEARRLYPELCFQGNVSQELLHLGTPDQVAHATRQCVAEGGGQHHIVNLNHGVDPGTPVANFEAYIRAARNA